MALPQTPLERALELARSGLFGTVTDIRGQLKRDGFALKQVDDALVGASVRLQLRALIRKAKGLPPPLISKAYQRNLKI